MARRSPTMPGHALPAGGRSSGSRPKKKFKVKKSRARKDAERKLEGAKEYSQDIKKLTNKRQQTRARTGAKVRKQQVSAARKTAARARGYAR